jgi:hypothetical protein
MLQADLAILERRQKILADEIAAALSHVAFDDPMITDLKSRVLYITEEIERLRVEVFRWSH